MEPIDDEGAEPTPVRNKRSWIVTAAVATGLAVGAAGLAGAATGGTRDRARRPRRPARPRYGQVPSGRGAERATARRRAGPGHDAERSR